MDLYVAIIVTISLLVGLSDLYIDLKHARPQRRRTVLKDQARMAVAAAEQRFRDNKSSTGADKAQYARAALLAAPGLKVSPTEADAAVEHAVSELVRDPPSAEEK